MVLHEPITVVPYCVKMSTELVELQYVCTVMKVVQVEIFKLVLCAYATC